MMFEDSESSGAPFRIVGLFSERQVRAGDLMEAAERAVESLPDEDPAASLSILPFGAADEAMHAFRAIMRPGDTTAPAEALVRVFTVEDTQSPHRALVDKLVRLGDGELAGLARDASYGARSFVEVAMGGLDHPDRILPFLSLVKVLAEAMDALVVDPSAAMVGVDLEEWAGAARMSIEMELALPALSGK